MSVINPGELKDSLIILAKTSDAIDENGFPVESMEEKFKLRCKKKTISTKEFIGSDREISELNYKFICRNRDIDNSMLVKYKNKTFDIKHVHEIDEHFIELTVAETTLEG
jgi:SPP1 family predicted phage head-tail adaptor